MVLVYIQEGDFLRDSPIISFKAKMGEKPQRTDWVDGYWIDKTEVTNFMYRKCSDVGACNKSKPLYRLFIHDRFIFQGGNQPVVMVDWNDARAYCAWAGRRLPTEAEWEKAARGSDGRMYPWGNQVPDPQFLNFNNNLVRTSEVGSYPSGASPYGVLDMAGNVWEWTADWYDGLYYWYSPAKNPNGPLYGKYRVMRGGSWDYSEKYVRTSSRYYKNPKSKEYDIGFRCATSGTPQ